MRHRWSPEVKRLVKEIPKVGTKLHGLQHLAYLRGQSTSSGG